MFYGIIKVELYFLFDSDGLVSLGNCECKNITEGNRKINNILNIFCYTESAAITNYFLSTVLSSTALVHAKSFSAQIGPLGFYHILTNYLFR